MRGDGVFLLPGYSDSQYWTGQTKKTPIGCGPVPFASRRSGAALAAFPFDQHRGRDFLSRYASIRLWDEWSACHGAPTETLVCNASAFFFQSGSHASRALHAPTAAVLSSPTSQRLSVRRIRPLNQTHRVKFFAAHLRPTTAATSHLQHAPPHSRPNSTTSLLPP